MDNREACKELVEWWDTGVCKQDGVIESVRLELEESRGEADMRDAEREILNRLARATALSQPAETPTVEQLQRRIKELEQKNTEYHRENSAYAALRLTLEGWEPVTAIHFWQGDESDDLQTLCIGVPVVIEAQTLRELLQSQKEERAEPVKQFGLNTGGGAWGAAEGKIVWFASEDERDAAFGEAHPMDCPRKVERTRPQQAESAKPIYQVRYLDEGWRDVQKNVFDKLFHYREARVVYTSSQPIVPENK